MIKKKKVKLLILLSVIWTGALSQDFRYQWKLDSVEAAGLYRLSIDRTITPFLKTDFSDLRIVDRKGNGVPHLITRTGERWSSKYFVNFPVQRYRLIDSGRSELILKDTSRLRLVDLQLFLDNASVSRLASISGSADSRNWYIISDNINISPSYTFSDSFSIQHIDLPGSQYAYYKLVIDNAKNDPLHILKAGAYINLESMFGVPYSMNPAPRIIQVDSARKSLVTLVWDRPFHHESLVIDIAAPPLFRREMDICLPEKNDESGQVIGHFTLLPGNKNRIDFPRVKTDSLILIIYNEDNSPLQIDTVFSAYWKYQALAFLQPGKNYHLLLDNPEASAPKYDLDFFKDSLQNVMPHEIALRDSATAITPPAPANAHNARKWWLWPALLIVIVSLSLLGIRLMKQMTKSDS